MVKRNQRIEIVASTERGLSSMGLQSRSGAQAVLAEHYNDVRVTNVNNMSDLEDLVARQPDLIFLGMKFLPQDPALGQHDPNKIWLAQYLDDHKLLYTGSDQQAHELELNKELAKAQVLSAGLSTARFQVMNGTTIPVQKSIRLQYPVFIKPTNRGGGVGIDSHSIAYDYSQLHAKVLSLADRLQSDSLVEEYLPGREFSVGILKDVDAESYNTMPIELVAPPDARGERFLSAQVKSADTERNLAVTDELLKTQLNSLALGIFHTLGARDYGRIDIRLDAIGMPYFLEANLLPSLLNNYGNFPKTCALNIGLGYEAMLLRIVELAFARQSHSDEMAPQADRIFLPTPLGSVGGLFNPA